MDDDWEFETPAKANPPQPPRSRPTLPIVGAAAVVIITILGLAGYFAFGRSSSGKAASAQTVTSSSPSPAAGPVVLPFTLADPEGVEVDRAGNVYVADSGGNRVLELPAGSNTPIELPFNGLNRPAGLAVDNKGDLFAVDENDKRVLELPAGSKTQIELPFTGLTEPHG